MTIALTLVGTWAAHQYSDEVGEKDPSSVVIDEVIGTLIAMGIARRSGITGELAAMVLFRVLDIWKPGVIDRAQHLKPAGVGIMADDVLAGIAAGLAVRVLRQR